MIKRSLRWLTHWLNVAQLYLLRLEINDARKAKNWGRYYMLRMEEVAQLRKTYPY
jgi:hypothetical protein